MSNVPHRPRPPDMCFPVGAIWEGPGNTALLEEVHYWLDLESHRQAPILVCTLPCFRLKVGFLSFLLPCCPCNYGFSFGTFSQKQTLL